MALVERGHPDVPLVTQAALLGVSRSSLYDQPMAPSPEEVALKHRIDALYTAYPFYGSRRIAAVWGREGTTLNRKAVQRHMREMGIAGISPGPNTSKRCLEHRVYPYLLRHTTSAYPNHIWGIDITYIRLRAGWMYLAWIIHENIHRIGLVADGGLTGSQSPLWTPKSALWPLLPVYRGGCSAKCGQSN